MRYFRGEEIGLEAIIDKEECPLQGKRLYSYYLVFIIDNGNRPTLLVEKALDAIVSAVTESGSGAKLVVTSSDNSCFQIGWCPSYMSASSLSVQQR
jgi:hypothetical protein